MLEVQLRVSVTPKELARATQSVSPHGAYTLTLPISALLCIHLAIYITIIVNERTTPRSADRIG